ncbi:MAG: efflux RND transporter permease subunit [Bacteroidaceae bacterium]|nr:efflux RND transporter permease subunit [Bacteroidaceae bacterium]
MELDFSRWGLSNSKLVSFFVAILVVGGIISYDVMPKLEDPAIKVKQAMVVTTYPGASAHEVELEVTDKIEKAIRQMPGIDNVQSQSMNDLSLITVELETTVKDADVEQHWDILRRKVSNAASSLPSTASTPIVRDDFGDVYGMFYALTADGLTDREMSDYAELIKRNVSDIDGVSRVEIYGQRQECIYIEMRQDKMANLGVMPVEVIQTLNNQNRTTYSGYYDNGTHRVRVTVDDRFKKVEDISNMIIQGHDDEQLRISDVARVYKGYADPTRNELKRDGQRALGISIAGVADKDIIKVGKQVEETIDELRKTMPLGVKFEKVFNQPERVESALNTFLVNLLESVLIVVVVLIFTMGFKSGLIIGLSLLTIVFGSLLVLGGFDGTLQRVSLAAFILAMGMLVDNAIVIVDGILVDLKQGRSRMEALTTIGRRTAMPLLGATLIAILAFWPIFLSPDTAGVYVRDLFIVIAVSLMLSWILALVHVPIMADRMLKAPEKTEGGNDDPYKGMSYTILEKIMNFGLRFRFIMIALAVGLVVLSVWSYKFLNQAFFPDMEYDQLYMEYKLPEGTNHTQVAQDLAEINEYLKSRKEVTHITTSIGGTPSRYNLVRSVATPSLSYGELIIDFETPKALVENIDDIQKELNKRYPDAYIKLKRYNLMFKKYPIEICFSGPDPSVLHRLADSAMAIVAASDKVYLPTSDWEPQVPVLSVEYDQPAARTTGLSRSDVATSILAYTSGIPIATFYDGIHSEGIVLKCTDAQGNDLDRIDNVPVFGMLPNFNTLFDRSTIQKLVSGGVDKDKIIEMITQTTPLKQVAKAVELKWEEPVVMRYNGQRQQRIQCSPRPGVGTEAARAAIAKQIEKIKLPNGYSLSWQGEKMASDRSMKYLFNGFPLAIILIIMILIMLFKDYKKPAIIFCCIPLIFVGVIPAVLVTGKPFGFVAIVGVLGLIGMMIKNGIVLMDEINLQISEGVEPRDALIGSSKSRLRPVMMASLTTILGMIPLIPDAMFGSLAVTIMGGLFVGTLITLIFIPILYAMFFKIK